MNLIICTLMYPPLILMDSDEMDIDEHNFSLGWDDVNLSDASSNEEDQLGGGQYNTELIRERKTKI